MNISDYFADYVLRRPHPRMRLPAIADRMTRHAWLRAYDAIFERSERFPPDRLAAIQEARLRTLVDRVRASSPFYRERLRDFRSHRDFTAIAPVTKHDLRTALDAGTVLHPGLASFKVKRSTSGSSGIPFAFFHDRNMYTRRIALYHRLLRWVGYREGDVAVWIMRELHPEFGAIPFVCFGPEDIERRKEELYSLLEGKPTILHAMTSHLIFLADLFERDGEKFNLKGVISYAEPLHSEVRRYLEMKFSAPLFDNYGSQEILNPGNECEVHDGFHINSEWAYLEVVGEDHRPLPPGQLGTVLMTSFDNEVMPFIRYKIGDLGCWMEAPCPCGRTLPRLKLSGRDLTYFIHPNGKVGDFISLVLPILERTPKILQFQVIRSSRFIYEFHIVPTPAFDDDCRNAIMEDIRKYLGPEATVTITATDEIPLGPGGKPRVFVNLENDFLTRVSEQGVPYEKHPRKT